MSDPERKIKYDGSTDQMALILGSTSVVAVCPVCMEELLIVRNWEEAKRIGRRPGIYCPKNITHMCETFIFESPGLIVPGDSHSP
jgi:hypothetical protein